MYISELKVKSLNLKSLQHLVVLTVSDKCCTGAIKFLTNYTISCPNDDKGDGFYGNGADYGIISCEVSSLRNQN